MKLIHVNTKYILKEQNHMVERDRDMVGYEFRFYLKFGETITSAQQSIEDKCRFSFHIEKEKYPLLWSHWKELRQEEILEIVYNSLKRYFKDFVTSEEYWRDFDGDKKENYNTVKKIDPLTGEEYESLEPKTCQATLNIEQYDKLTEEKAIKGKVLPYDLFMPPMDQLHQAGFGLNTIIEFKET